MQLFNQLLNALDNPNQQANPQDLGGMVGAVDQLSQSTGVNPSVTQSVLSIVGQYVRSSLQQRQATQGWDQTAAIVDQYGGTQANPQAVNMVFNPMQQQQVAQAVAQQTGLNPALIQAMLPVVVPLILNFLRSGAQSQTQSGGYPGSNPLAQMFLDADRDGDVDMGDMVGLAGQWLSQRR